jgi:hypothetical protein
MVTKMESRSQIKGQGLDGVLVEYDFRLLDALTGLQIVHEFVGLILTALPTLAGILHGFRPAPGEDPDAPTAETVEKRREVFTELIRIVPSILTFPRLKLLCAQLLSGSKVGGEECGPDGMCPRFAGNPLAIYTALFWAVVVNFPKYIDPLSAALRDAGTEGREDMTQE